VLEDSAILDHDVTLLMELLRRIWISVEGANILHLILCFSILKISYSYSQRDRLCGLVVRVSGYRSRGPGFDSQRFQIFLEAAGLERDPLSLVRTTEELHEGKVAAPVYRTKINDRGNPLR
jgi:hypothetical protein